MNWKGYTFVNLWTERKREFKVKRRHLMFDSPTSRRPKPCAAYPTNNKILSYKFLFLILLKLRKFEGEGFPVNLLTKLNNVGMRGINPCSFTKRKKSLPF